MGSTAYEREVSTPRTFLLEYGPPLEPSKQTDGQRMYNIMPRLWGSDTAIIQKH